MEWQRAAKLQALKAVLAPDFEAWLRGIFRWYSKEYSTPLTDVFDLPIDFILQQWWETQYENMEAEDRIQLAKDLIEDPIEKEARLERDQQNEEEFFKRSSERAKHKLAKKPKNLMRDRRGEAKLPQPMKPSAKPKLPDIPQDIIDELVNFSVSETPFDDSVLNRGSMEPSPRPKVKPRK